MEASTVSSLVTTVGSFLTESIGWLGEISAAVVSDPLLTIMVVCMPVAGFGIGMLRRVMGL